MTEKKKRKKRILTEEHKEKIRQSMLENGYTHSPKTRKIMSEMRRSYWEKRSEENDLV